MIPDPLENPPPAALADLNRRLHRKADGAVIFLDDAGISILAPARGYAEADPREAMAWIRQAHPELWGGESAKMLPAAPVASGPMNWTASMAAARRGDAGAREALDVAVSGPAPFNVTTAMTAARRGDATALAALDAHMKNSSR